MSIEPKTVPTRGRHRCAWLFVSLMALSFFHPFATVFDRILPQFDGLLGALLYTGLLVAGVYALSDTKRHVVIAALLAAPVLVLVWISGFVSLLSVKVAYLFFAILFVVFAEIRLLNYVLKGQEVVVDKIFGALSVYLLFGHTWAFIFIILESLQPGSFAGLTQSGLMEGIGSELIYYSFVTLTTLGYGEITPVTMIARNLAAMEAVTGVLYTATLIARLVGMYRGKSG